MMTFSLSNLKQVKNSVIGNPSAKLRLSKDLEFVQTIVNCLTDTPDGEDVRIEAAQVIASISYGSEAVLATLLRCDAPRAFLYALSKLTLEDGPAVRAAFTRGLRALTSALADTVGPSQWGLMEERTAGLRNLAEGALDLVFQTESLDVILPLLEDRVVPVAVSIAQLLGLAIRNTTYRVTVVEWIPPQQRIKTDMRSNRGWEKSAVPPNNTDIHGSWICRQLTKLVCGRDSQLQEAALWALSVITKDNAAIVGTLNRTMDTGEPFLSLVLSFIKSRSTNLQLAACSCATSIIRATYPSTNTTTSSFVSDPPLVQASSNIVINVVNRIISTPATDENLNNRSRACFILFNLVSDHPALCTTAYERGCLTKLVRLLNSFERAPPNAASSSLLFFPSEGQEEEPTPIAGLREAALTTIAALALFDNTIRRSITDEHGTVILPIIHAGLTHHSLGVRYASCQCVRALSRAVAVLRTNLVDSGLGRAVFRVFLKEERKQSEIALASDNRETIGNTIEGEDRRVTAAALAAVCNIVNEFSPLRPVYLNDGLVQRLVKLVNSDDVDLRLSSLWAMKNLLHKSSHETKRDVMQSFGWRRLLRLLEEPNNALQEQAWAVLRNLAEDDSGVEMISREREFGGTVLLAHVTRVLKSSPTKSSSDDDIILQAACLLGNLANVNSMQSLITGNAELLGALRMVLAERNPSIRRPIVAAVLELAKGSTVGRKALVDAGLGGTLQTVTATSRHSSVSGPTSLGIHHSHMEDDRDVIDQAKTALSWLEHGETYR
ncbi:hypothetical protein MIND_01168700 [Mycena indigotica]|uniref:Armadillo repeat-containing protein 8 n=1 Tax=Mycena indigotica TaxID=2126181 RepID=A0A8H6S7F3_9AGAR|nr:uncharacterized protein MIND_01168700 [Mycena indigotica]KAF7292705.1 hypothetical protein MIND_01168700 [Mycena indigotica]